MSKNIKVSDKTHELLMSLRGEGESIDEVIAVRLQSEVETPMEKVTRELFEFKHFLITLQKNASEATPQVVRGRKTAGGVPRTAAATFTPTDTPEPLEQRCCAGKSPCKHWSYEPNQMMYINSLSGRRKEVEA